VNAQVIALGGYMYSPRSKLEAICARDYPDAEAENFMYGRVPARKVTLPVRDAVEVMSEIRRLVVPTEAADVWVELEPGGNIGHLKAELPPTFFLVGEDEATGRCIYAPLGEWPPEIELLGGHIDGAEIRAMIHHPVLYHWSWWLTWRWRKLPKSGEFCAADWAKALARNNAPAWVIEEVPEGWTSPMMFVLTIFKSKEPHNMTRAEFDAIEGAIFDLVMCKFPTKKRRVRW